MDVRDQLPTPRRLDVSMADLREALAAPGCPDEGARGSLADKLKLKAACDAEILRAAAAALSLGPEAVDAAAMVRSIAITPQAAVYVSKEVGPSLCKALRRKEPQLVAWALMALIRLAQFPDTHGLLRRADAVQSLALFTRPQARRKSEVRLDLLASMGLAFLSETMRQEQRPEICALVPLRLLPELVQLLCARLQMTSDEVVSSCVFCGMPVDYRPRFVAQSLAALCEASAAHAAMAWQSNLPFVICEVLSGRCPNDAEANLPFGSPDVVEMASRCRSALLAHASKRSMAPPQVLADLKSAPAAPKGTWAKRGDATRKVRSRL
ncbi:unnamed protein product [Effrenium voratum]|uniref:Uncharacterized protein n=1 Tax=Effrenium voratum TaxID=2562239 RepID=A0AA36MVE7_9DINO|nr:unnamed protein product [Effrenium voratum]CAJ1452182.1 unnamed protein product [Effrenium voratum]